MATAPFNDGTRVGSEARPVSVGDVSSIGAVVTARNADTCLSAR
jgi:hypothetical protein